MYLNEVEQGRLADAARARGCVCSSVKINDQNLPLDISQPSHSTRETGGLSTGWGGTGKWIVRSDALSSCSLFLNHSGDAQEMRHQQGLHFSTASHLRVRWLKTLAQFSPQYQRTRHKEGVFQIIGPTERSIEKGVAEIGPLGRIRTTSG